MTTYEIAYIPDAAHETGLGWRVSCYITGKVIWQQFCATYQDAIILKEVSE